jgi:hypothetical protein
MQPARIRKLTAVVRPVNKGSFARHARLLAGVPFQGLSPCARAVLAVLMAFYAGEEDGAAWPSVRELVCVTPRPPRAGAGPDAAPRFYSPVQVKRALRELAALRRLADGTEVRLMLTVRVKPGECYPGRDRNGRLVPGAGRYASHTGGRVFVLQYAVLRDFVGSAGTHFFQIGRSLNDRSRSIIKRSPLRSSESPSETLKFKMDPADRAQEVASAPLPPVAPETVAKRSRAPVAASASPPTSSPTERPKESERERCAGKREQKAHPVALAHLVAIGTALSSPEGIGTALRLVRDLEEGQSQRVDTCSDTPAASSPGDANAAPRTPTCTPDDV